MIPLFRHSVQILICLNDNLLQQIPGFFGIFDLNSKFRSVNQTGASWTGFENPDAMCDLSYEDVKCKAAEHAEIFHEHDKIVKQQGQIRFLGYYCYANQDWKIILGEKYLITNPENNPIGIVSHFNDYTNANLIDISRFLIKSTSRFIHKKNDQQFIFLFSDEKNNLTPFTIRQLESLFFYIRGKTIKEIARILNLSPRTIESYLDQVKIKLNCQNRYELIEKAIIEGYMNILPVSLFEILNNVD